MVLPPIKPLDAVVELRERDDRQSRVILAHVVGLGWGFLCARVRVVEAPAFQNLWQSDLGLRSNELMTTTSRCRLFLLCRPHQDRDSRAISTPFCEVFFKVLRTLSMPAMNEVEEGAKATKD